MKKIGLIKTMTLIGLIALLAACKPERLIAPAEPVKNVTGSWQIIKATRNGTDLTTRFDFTQFRIQFTDSTYTINNLVPFIVSKAGKWSFDNPQYPFFLNFTATDSAVKTSPLLYPVTSGQRNILITFSPGCTQNSYQYTLQKTN